MLKQELIRASETGEKVWVYIGSNIVSGFITSVDDEYVLLTKLTEGPTVTRDRYIIRLDRVDYISCGETETWDKQRLRKLMEMDNA